MTAALPREIAFLITRNNSHTKGAIAGAAGDDSNIDPGRLQAALLHDTVTPCPRA